MIDYIKNQICNFIFHQRGFDERVALENLTMRMIAKLGNNAYPGAIREEIEKELGQDFPIGRVYFILGILEAKQFIKSHQEPGGPERNYRSKRVVEFTNEEMKKLWMDEK